MSWLKEDPGRMKGNRRLVSYWVHTSQSSHARTTRLSLSFYVDMFSPVSLTDPISFKAERSEYAEMSVATTMIKLSYLSLDT
jgi:hypothetical protein